MTPDQGILDVQVRALAQALRSPAYRHNRLARAIFEARLVTLRLASMAAETTSAFSGSISDPQTTTPTTGDTS